MKNVIMIFVFLIGLLLLQLLLFVSPVVHLVDLDEFVLFLTNIWSRGQQPEQGEPDSPPITANNHNQ